MIIKTADLCDAHGDRVTIAQPLFNDYGGVRAFGGEIVTVRVFEDNVLVRGTLEQSGVGRVLVVDGGGSLRCALLGDQLAALAAGNGWAGVVINGAIRDADEIGAIQIGVKALATCPRKSVKQGRGETDVAVEFASAVFKPGAFVYADGDGLIVADEDLKTG